MQAYDARYTALNAAAESTPDRALRLAVLEVIDAGRVNADDTVKEKAAEAADWGRLFIGTLQSELSFCDNRRVVAWFAAHGITF